MSNHSEFVTDFPQQTPAPFDVRFLFNTLWARAVDNTENASRLCGSPVGTLDWERSRCTCGHTYRAGRAARPRFAAWDWIAWNLHETRDTRRKGASGRRRAWKPIFR